MAAATAASLPKHRNNMAENLEIRIVMGNKKTANFKNNLI
jgi:hypothetical protein